MEKRLTKRTYVISHGILEDGTEAYRFILFRGLVSLLIRTMLWSKGADGSYHLHLLRHYHKELGGILQPMFVSPWIPDENSNQSTQAMTTVPNLAFVQRRTPDVVSQTHIPADIVEVTGNGELGNSEAFSKPKSKLEKQGYRVGGQSTGWI